MNQLRRWKCHKEVLAAKILGVEDTPGDTYLVLDGTGAVEMEEPVSGDWLAKHNPQIGGYFVRYADGYESYSPAEAFESGYTRLDAPGGISFGDAIRELKAGKRVARAGWNGKGMWLALMPGFVIPKGMINERTRQFVSGEQDLNCGAYITMWTAQGVWQPGWLASQPDMLSEDWEVVS